MEDFYNKEYMENIPASEYNKLKNELAQAEMKFRSFLDSSSVGIWCFKPETPIDDNLPEEEMIEQFFRTTCIDCNTRYAEMLGVNVENLIGSRLSDILPKTPENVEYLKTFIHNGFQIVDGLTHEVTPEGEDKYFLNSFVATRENGKLALAWGTQVDVTESKKTEVALQESERRLSTMVDNLPGIAYQCKNDPNRTMLYISRRALYLTGYASKDFIGSQKIAYVDIIHPDDRQRIFNEVQEAITRNELFQMEYRIITKHNITKWVWEQGRGVNIPGQQDIILEGLIIETTERKQAEIRTQIMRNIAVATGNTNNITEWIDVIRNELGQVINTKNFILALYDDKHKEFSLPYMKDERDHFDAFPVGKTISAIAIKKKKSIFLKGPEIDELERKGKIERFGSPAKSWLGVPLKVNEKVVGIIILQDYEREDAISTFDRDMLEFVSTQVAGAILKKQSEEEIRKLLQSVEQNPNPVIMMDVDGKIEYVNAKFCEISGYTPEDVMGSLPHILNPDQTNQNYIDIIWNALLSGDDWHGEYQNVKKNGVKYWELASISSIKNEEGKTTHYVYVKEDISRRKKMEDDLKEAKGHAEESDKLKTAFLANMSHEIRTPMNAIIGFTEMLSEEYYSEEEHDKFISLVLENGRKLLNILDDIIDIAKIEAGQLNISSQRCSANKILFDNFYTFKQLKAKLNKDHIEIRTAQHDPEKNFLFISDPHRINQVISNLVSNALKYTQEGFIEIGYKIFSENDRDFIDYFVTDSGIGIQKHQQELIFDRFRQIDMEYKRSSGGTGLGLAISRNIARILGGDISIESDLGKGATFHFTIPYHEIVPDSLKVEKPVIKSDKPDWSDKCVMIAEDEDSNYQLLEIMLRKTKVKVLRAYHGKEALDFIRGGKKVHLILMDVRMPVMDGYEATALIKEFNPKIPVVIQTAFALAGDREISFEAGCDDYLSKPIKSDELLKTLTKFL